MTKELQKQAERLRQTGQIFLDINPTSDIGVPKEIHSIYTAEDMEFPVLKKPVGKEVELTKQVVEKNQYRREIPTTVENTTTYYVRCGQEPGAVEISKRNQRVDLGYKVPTVSSEEVVEVMSRIVSRSDYERKQAEWNKALYDELLADETQVIELSPSTIANGKLRITQQDNITGLASSQEIFLKGGKNVDRETGDLLSHADFNLLSKLQSERHNLQPNIVERVDAVLKSFLGK